MTFSKVASGTTPYGTKVPKSNPRRSKIDMFIVHHAATRSDKGLLAIFAQDGGRGTSANYAVLRDGTVLGAVPEEQRAWTSGGKRDGATVDGSVYDHRAITVETVNDTEAPTWSITAGAFESLARLIEDCSSRYGFPLDRNHVVGHGELLKRFSASYATACPGGISVDALVSRAREIRSTASAPTPVDAPASTTLRKEEDMTLPTHLGARIWLLPNGLPVGLEPQRHDAFMGYVNSYGTFVREDKTVAVGEPHPTWAWVIGSIVDECHRAAEALRKADTKALRKEVDAALAEAGIADRPA